MGPFGHGGMTTRLKASMHAYGHSVSDTGGMTPKIITVWAPKGGVGKTTLAYELAYMLDGPLIDFEWDSGSASYQWGLKEPEPVEKARLIRAFRTGNAPRPLRQDRRPDLVPGHPDLEDELPDPERIADLLAKWAVEWDRPYVVIDTHPGSGKAGRGALAPANVVVIPAVLKTKELNALEVALGEYRDYPLLVVPNMIPPVPPARELDRFRRMVREAEVPVAPPVSNHVWWSRRVMPGAISAYSEDQVPAKVYTAYNELRRVAEEVSKRAER
jgi:chromosome partitioning protein